MTLGIPPNDALLWLPSGEWIHLDRKVTVGRAPDNDVVLDHPTVSRYHCTISPENGSLVISDRNSSFGTVINGTHRVRDTYELKDSDSIRLGEIELRIQWQRDRPATPASGSSTPEIDEVTTSAVSSEAQQIMTRSARIYVRRGPGEPRVLDWDGNAPFTIGRSSDSSLIVPNGTLSQHHAEIREKDGSPVIYDLGGANGLRVNGSPVSGSQEIESGDCVTVGAVELVFNPVEDGDVSASLIQGDPGHEVAEFTLDSSATTLGSAPNCHIQLPDSGAPREHARVQRFFSDYWVIPTSNDPPVLLNHSAINGPALLAAGDRLQIGAVELVFQQRAVSPAGALTPPIDTLTLREIAPFSTLDETVFNALVAAGTTVTFAPHAIMMKPDTRKKPRNGALIVLLSGEAEVRGPVGGDWKKAIAVTRLSAGEYCGERVLAYGQAYPYQVEATTRVQAFSIRLSEYRKLTQKVPSFAGFFKDKVARHGMVKYLREVPLFSQFGPDALAQLADKMKLRAFPAGDILARKGEICRVFYLVASGTCRVDAIQANALVTLTNLTEGKFTGEQIAGQEEVYPYSIVADTAVDAYLVTRDEFLALAEENPDAVDFGASGLPPSVILHRTPPFSDLAPELVATAARSLHVKHVQAGEIIVYQDDPVADTFYIIADGKVEVLFRNREGEERSLVQLKPGECFGEAALLTGSPRNATVRALEDCALLTLYRREFTEMLTRSPQQVGQFLVFTHNSRNRPKRIENVEIFEERIRNRVGYILKNRDRNTYVKLSEQGLFVWDLLDGEHTLTDIAAAYFQRYQTLAMGPMIETIAQLQRLGFIDVNMDSLMKLLSQKARLTPLQHVMVFAFRALTAKVEFKNAHAYFSALYHGFCKIFFFKPVLVLLALINIAGVAEFTRLLISGSGTASLRFSAASLPVLIVLTVVITITHEMGHGVTMIHIGRRVLGAGLGWNYIAPMAFVNTTDAWLATKGQRLAVTAGGLIVTTTEAALFTLALLVVEDSTLRGVFALGASLAYLTFLFNANPMVPTDGYNFLVDLLRIQDLRPRALHYIFSGSVFRDLWKRTLGGEQRAYAVFGLFVAIFMAYGGLSIALLISQFATQPLKSFLPVPAVIAIQLALIALLFIFFILGLLREARIGAQKAR